MRIDYSRRTILCSGNQYTQHQSQVSPHLHDSESASDSNLDDRRASALVAMPTTSRSILRPILRSVRCSASEFCGDTFAPTVIYHGEADSPGGRSHVNSRLAGLRAVACVARLCSAALASHYHHELNWSHNSASTMAIYDTSSIA